MPLVTEIETFINLFLEITAQNTATVKGKASRARSNDHRVSKWLLSTLGRNKNAHKFMGLLRMYIILVLIGTAFTSSLAFKDY
jgi:hypothetical protein